jgi:tRNA-specific 2-thiouridylase
MAVERGLPTADKMKSQDICFIPDGNHRAFLAAGISLRPGEILDTAGRVLGKHEGVAFYTVGQRHGLGLVSKERLYVTRIDSSTDTLVVGGEQELYSDCAFASSVKFVCGKPLCEPMTITAKIRYRSPGAEAVLCPRDESVAEIRFDYPQRAITPGQAVVFYKGDVVLGGGIIEDGTGSFYGAEYGAFR